MNLEIFKILYFVTWIRNHFGEGSQKDAVSASGFIGFITTERRLSRARKMRLRLKNIRIRLDVALRSLFLSGKKLFAKKCLYI